MSRDPVAKVPEMEEMFFPLAIKASFILMVDVNLKYYLKDLSQRFATSYIIHSNARLNAD